MKKLTILKYYLFLASVLSLTACLKKGDINADPSKSTSYVLALRYADGSTVIESGLTYFSAAALTFPSSDETDTLTVKAALSSPGAFSKDLTVTVGADANALNDNYSSDSITYEAMPDTIYKILNTTATIKAGESEAEIKVVFYPSKIDITRNFMLPLTFTDAAGQTVSGNFGHIYFHTIGNPLAGAYLHDFTRYNTVDGSGAASSLSYTGDDATFSPVNPTTINVQTGYYDAANYVITFKNTAGVLSDFSAIINSTSVTGAWATAGISIIKQPEITVSADYKDITIEYSVASGTAYRYIIDHYYK